MKNNPALIALGSNQSSIAGGPRDTLNAAIEALIKGGLKDVRKSRFYATPCFPAGAGPDYVNAAALVVWDGTAQALLTLLHEIEAQFGRARERRWGQRTLDLDLIALGGQVLPDRATYDAWLHLPLEEQRVKAPEELILPHPRLAERGFVLVPLMDIAPDWSHPVSGKTVRQMTAALSQAQRDEVRAL